MFSEKEKLFIEKRGSSLALVEKQIENFKTGFPFIQAKAPATVGEGILRLTEEDLELLTQVFDLQAPKNKLLKFVPASGAASRMFKALYAAKDNGKMDDSVRNFFENLPEFAFYDALLNAIGGYGGNQEILDGLLTEKGLDYGNLPKGLLLFHSYGKKKRTAVEEHLVEGAHYANRNGRVRLHFTVSPEHKSKFKKHIAAVKEEYEKEFHVQYIISYSEQKAETDTIAVDRNNSPFLMEDGMPLFRPAGHGALLSNLNDQEADIIFIKNIDNVVPDHLKASTITYKKALAGILIQTRKRIFNFAKRLDQEKVSAYTITKALSFLKNDLNVLPPKGFRNWKMEDKLAFAKEKINRPLRVCGMVKNVGEPGGGPFWVKNEDGSVSLQIVESAQFNLKAKKQEEIFKSATHFNPVDLVVSTKNYKKEPYNLFQFRDDKTGFISEKSMSGKVLKAQELPGLWNGSMAFWNTIFVEVPLETFNPVKTVNDLLRKEHQPE